MLIQDRISSMSEALRTNEAATKSMSFWMPYLMSARSFSLMAGSCTFAPGRFTPRRDAISPSFMMRHTTSPPPSMAVTVKDTAPSSRSTVPPTLTVDARAG